MQTPWLFVILGGIALALLQADGEQDFAARRQHWALQPLRAVTPPADDGQGWARSPVDRFILDRLRAEDLAPAPDADRATWLRRVSFDLIGLPPTPAEVADFEAAEPGAERGVVERLLASPHFGEKWARHWLDLVRYADTRGHEFDHPIPNAFQYRDYVIRALNADLRYDRFVTEQVAGDLLEEPRLHPDEGFNESVLGTGLWLLGEEFHSPVDIRRDETDRIANKIDVLSKTFLGLTVACARCHDHKFDAISTEDYYALSGFASSSNYRQVRFDSLEHNRAVSRELEGLRERWAPRVVKTLAQKLARESARVEELLLAVREVSIAGGSIEETARERGLEAKTLERWVKAAEHATDPAHPLFAWARLACSSPGEEIEPAELEHLIGPVPAPAGGPATVQVDYAQLSPGDWIQDGFAFGARPARPMQALLRAEAAHGIERFCELDAAFADPTWDRLELAAGTEPESVGVDWVQSGRTLWTPSFTLSSGRLWYLVRGAARLYAAVDSHRLIDGPLHGALKKELHAGDGFRWIEHDLEDYRGHRLHLELTPTAGSGFALARVVDSAHEPESRGGVPAALAQRLSDGVGDVRELAAAYRSLFAEPARRLADGNSAPDDVVWLNAWLRLAADDSPAGLEAYFEGERALVRSIQVVSRTAPALMDGSGLDELLLRRGNHETPLRSVPRRFLEAIAGTDQPPIASGSGRLELARHLTDPSNPLVARVYVNRVWQQLFGRGLVASVDDFGAMGEPPSHPDLLDWLARRFIDGGWSTKDLIGELVLSRTYRMSSAADERARRLDPENRWWHAMGLRRLPAESIRDAILALSGELDVTLYGAPVAIHLTAFMEGRGRPAQGGPLDGAGRRSIYLALRRNFLVPMFTVFDFPAPATCIGRRNLSNVPAQALTLMNDPFVVEQALRWAERIALEPEVGVTERIDGMLRAAFARGARPQELSDCGDFVAEQARLYATDVGDVRVWADLAHVLFNAKEFVFLR